MTGEARFGDAEAGDGLPRCPGCGVYIDEDDAIDIDGRSVCHLHAAAPDLLAAVKLLFPYVADTLAHSKQEDDHPSLQHIIEHDVVTAANTIHRAEGREPVAECSCAAIAKARGES